MNQINPPPKEGDLYKKIRIGEHIFELRYGYYTESDRTFGEPAVIFPDLSMEPLYTEDGCRIVTAIQDPCPHYKVPKEKVRDECCCDCEHYRYNGDDIGLCACAEMRISKNTTRPY